MDCVAVQGAPTLMLHGFTLTGASWDAVRARLPDRCRAIAPDLRGHGRASAATPVILDGVIADLTSLVDGLGPDPPTVVGYSQGGRIALHLALALGPRIGGLVLVGASPGIADPAERAARRWDDERLAAEIEAMTIEQVAERWARTPVLSGQPAAVAVAARADRLRSTPAGLARALRGLGTGALPPLWDRLGELRVPTTLIAGERDAKFAALARAMAARIGAGARVAVVPGAGHAVHLEAPAAVAGLIVDARVCKDPAP
jgi:2-succinyl-6-hydroxy-2,4-cyclohexadiene-1-carboxylate synthase